MVDNNEHMREYSDHRLSIGSLMVDYERQQEGVELVEAEAWSPVIMHKDYREHF